MSRIQRLSDTLISQIAAGEVIERPASVVKELVENAIDAEAKRIEVELEDGGLTRIVVSDDGIGMTPEEAALAIERHATSKLRTSEDLFRIHTLGFRGEALPSIASVSRFELTTRPRERDVGFRLRIEGGQVHAPEDVGAPVGTRFVVSDLFFNQPARKKFQKTAATEQSHAVNAALRIALAYRDVRVTVRAKGRQLLDVPMGEERERIAAALGHGLAPKLYPFSLERDGVHVHGFAGDPELQASDARNVYAYVNGRYVRDRLLQRAILEGYRSLLPHGRFPTIVLRLDVPPSAVDVNVHPQKFEVRFSDASSVFGLVLRAIAETLAKTPWLQRGGARVYKLDAPSGPLSFGSPADPFEPPRATAAPQVSLAPAGFASPSFVAPAFALPSAVASPGMGEMPPAATEAQAIAPSTGFFTGLRILSQFSNLYILCEQGNELVVVDQHAAHERVTFEKLINAWEAGAVPQQRLLFPLTLKVRPDQVALVEEHADALMRMGLEMRRFGEDTIAVAGVPAMVRESRAKAYAEEALGELSDAGRQAAAEFAHALLARVACHASVRSGDPLSMPEMQALLVELDRVDCNVRCPHGRPVVARVTRDQIGRWFERG